MTPNPAPALPPTILHTLTAGRVDRRRPGWIVIDKLSKPVAIVNIIIPIPSRSTIMQQPARRAWRVRANRLLVWLGAPARRIRNHQMAVFELRNHSEHLGVPGQPV